MTQQAEDGAAVGGQAHAEDRMNWARRRAHARQRAADARQRRIAYSLAGRPAPATAPGESAAPHAGNGSLTADGARPTLLPGAAADPAPASHGADAPLPSMDAEC